MNKNVYIFNNREATVIVPDKCRSGNPWVWRAEFLGAFDYADQALLENGWYIVYYNVSDMYGCPEAISLMKEFYNDVVMKFNLSKKADMFGFSRGGLYAVNYAAQYPSDINLLYLDAPVLDIRSWPAGMWNGEGGKGEWQDCMRWYGLAEECAEDFSRNPIDKVDVLVDSGIPVILVAGDSDTVVPFSENGEVFAKKYSDRGGEIKVILKKGCGHHPHSLYPPDVITEFVILHQMKAINL